jgi:muconolactone D-isomerase
MEFLVRINVLLPPDTATEVDLHERELRRGQELRASGVIARIWRIPGQTANVGIWRAEDATKLHAAISSLPLFPWMTVEVTPLATHHLEESSQST